MKLTKSQIEEIIYMKDKVPTMEILKKFSIQRNTFNWHTNPEFRQRIREYQNKRYNMIPLEKRREIFKQKRDYQRVYHRERFQRDEQFKKKQLESNRKYLSKPENLIKKKEWNKKYRERKK